MRTSTVVFAAIAALSACSRVEEAALVKIKQGELYPPVANVEVDLTAASRGPDLMILAAVAVRRIGAETVESKTLLPGVFRDVNITFVARGTAGSPATLMHATFEVDRLRDAVRAKLSGDDLLNVATEIGTSTPINDDVVDAHCRATASAVCLRLR